MWYLNVLIAYRQAKAWYYYNLSQFSLHNDTVGHTSSLNIAEIEEFSIFATFYVLTTFEFIQIHSDPILIISYPLKCLENSSKDYLMARGGPKSISTKMRFKNGFH